MRQAFMLLGVMTMIVFVGALVAFERAEAPGPVSDNKNATMVPETTMKLTLSSPAFEDGEKIPSRYTCDGENISPELHIENVPEGTKSFVLVMDDPDIPDAVKQRMHIEKFDHWVLYNIPPEMTVIPEGGVIGTTGLNSSGSATYTGACPPDREHRYFFRLYALRGTLNFIKAPTLSEVETAAQSMSLGSTTLMGRYERK